MRPRLEDASLFTFVVAGLTTTAVVQLHLPGRDAARRSWRHSPHWIALLVTMLVHLPLNDSAIPRRITVLAETRDEFEATRPAASLARTVPCIPAVAYLGRALSLHGRNRSDGAPRFTRRRTRRRT